MNGPPGCAHGGGIAICANCRVRSISICAALSDEELHALSVLARDVRYEPGEEIVAQGSRADSLWNVTEGVVRLVRTMADGRRQIVGFLYPGDFLGLGLAPDYANAAEAVSEVRACRFDRRPFEALLRRHPKLIERLHRSAAHELSVAQDHVVALGRQTAEERVARFLLSLQRRRIRAGGPVDHVELPMNRQDIADHLGLTVETVSRTISKLARAGTLGVTRGGVTIASPARLESLAAA